MDTQPVIEKKPWHKRRWVWIVAIFFTVGLVGSLGAQPTPNNSTTTESEAEPVAAIKVTATELASEYKENEIAADAKYKGKIVEITGTTDSIAKDIVDDAYVTFKGGQYEIINRVQCYIKESNESTFAGLTPGQEVTLRGKVDGGALNIVVKDCEIVIS